MLETALAGIADKDQADLYFDYGIVKGGPMKGRRILFGVSIVLLVLVAVAINLGALGNVYVAFSGRGDRIGSLTFDQLRSMGADDAIQAIRGRRLTATTWALGYGVLFAWIVFGPYRRKERWAWWALLASLVVPQIISMARVLFIGTLAGTQAAAMLMAFGLLGLLVGTPCMFSRIDPL
jgi:hypothetical protein